jgi:hypothetical protein
MRADMKEMTAADRMQFNQKNFSKLQLWGQAQFTRKRLAALRKQRNSWESRKGITDKQREEKLDSIELKMKDAVDRFNKRWNEVN